MRIIFFILSIILLYFSPISHAQKLTNKSYVSILTCSPGQELYSVFGHSAIRVCDSSLQIDIVYNYGTFDFDTPFFYWKFTKGRLDYKLSKTNFNRFVFEYQYFERGVVEQVLDLTLKEKQILLENLEINYKPENRYYRYDFFFDNCATRIREIVEKSVSRQITYNYNSLAEGKTYSSLLREYLQKSPWIDLGISLLMGKSANQKAPKSDYEYLPDYLHAILGGASIKEENNSYSLVREENILLGEKNTYINHSLFSKPIFFSIIFLAIVLLMSYFELKRKNRFKWFDKFFFTVISLFGILLLFLWFFSDIKAFDQNLNLIWALPFSGLLIFIKNRFSRNYFLIYSVGCIIFLAGMEFLPQYFDKALIPIILAIISRGYVMYKTDEPKTI